MWNVECLCRWQAQSAMRSGIVVGARVGCDDAAEMSWSSARCQGCTYPKVRNQRATFLAAMCGGADVVPPHGKAVKALPVPCRRRRIISHLFLPVLGKKISKALEKNSWAPLKINHFFPFTSTTGSFPIWDSHFILDCRLKDWKSRKDGFRRDYLANH